jgi:hypothetical protein
MTAILAAWQSQQLLKIKIPAVVLAGTEFAVEAGAADLEPLTAGTPNFSTLPSHLPKIQH